MIGASIFIISSLIIALLGSPSKFTTESGIFGVMMIDVLPTKRVADPTASLTSGFTTLYLVTVAAARMLQIHDWTKCLPNGLRVKRPKKR
jgi:hypothetical protein